MVLAVVADGGECRRVDASGRRGVGPTVIPSVAKIRARFNDRRKGIGVLDKLLRRVLGLDATMAQYRDGAMFVRAVVDKAGMSGFNVVWEQPEHLRSATAPAAVTRPRSSPRSASTMTYSLMRTSSLSAV